MPWYALDSVSDAFDESKALLFPFDLKRWVVLAVITFFVGGSGGAPQFNQTFGQPSQGDVPSSFPIQDFWLLLIGFIALLVVIGLILLILGSIMEFVFVDALRSRDVRIRGPFGDNLGAGLRLAGFRFALFLGMLLVFAMVLGPVYAAIVMGTPVALLALVVLLPLAIVLGLTIAVIQDFTTAFVVALVGERGGGIVGTWRQDLWPTVRAAWQQFLLYIVVKWGLGLAVGLAVGIALTLVFLPVLLLVGVGLFTGGATPAIIAVGVVLALVLFVLVQLFVNMPITVFLRYYSLSVLDKSELDWALHPSEPETDPVGDGSADDPAA